MDKDSQKLANILKENKTDHFNFEESVNYRVSGGSLGLDFFLGGGFGPGLHRFTGMNEGGKTSQALEVMKNFLLSVEGGKGMYIKAEGRLSEEMKARSGIKFVWDPKDWVEGTCFVFECNIYEVVAETILDLVDSNEENHKYCFVLDSVDGLISKNDVKKSFEDSMKVAGGAVIAATFMKKSSIKLAKRGHMAIFISQVRAEIKLDPYSKAPVRQTTATGGNALLHFANWILEFEPRFKGDLIVKNPKAQADPKQNPILGHFAKVTVKKSPNEKTNYTIHYPIIYGRTGGKSIWLEKELVDMLILWEFISQKGAWVTLSDEFVELLEENKISGVPTKINGQNQLFDLIETNSALSEFLINYFKSNMEGLGA
jgi:RecA/RadA recombinase